MELKHLTIPEIILITPPKFGDDRGFFSETFRQEWLEALNISTPFIQDNHARSAHKAVIRGLHFQYGDAAQTKLIRVVKGAILDVAVDIRHGSPTFGQHVSAELSAENWQQLLVPRGFAHGYCTLEADTEVVYKVDNYFAPDREASLAWDDPELNISWPFPDESIILSDKDRTAPLLTESAVYFRYDPAIKPFSVACLKEPEVHQ
ncbi:dTDP-4-dehydrorhamnose 3,5-epimerase [Parvularcula sp. IMCC14364]|uniref:dTDP-4-dehydrorhamnose 3,5-epimerase n=1 Tax=Parvularcula sp. IMCC14364 TaxID=3067902 RepID=UPI00274088F5|nr:dTDP-4-dehydrorhamnose 3,5-epimerase [Parvularcula sp. IMCC14364]